MSGQRGVALISAIFLLVVLAALALYMLSLSGTQHYTALWAVQGARAHYAAHSGLQWGAWQAVNGGCPTATTLAVDAGAPATFDVAVSCTSSGSYTELGVGYTVWQIDATAQFGTLGSPAHAQRRQRATVVTSP